MDSHIAVEQPLKAFAAAISVPVHQGCENKLDVDWQQAPIVLSSSVYCIAAQWTYVDALLFKRFAVDIRSFVVSC